MPSFVDLFSGAGGLSLGLSNAGWTPLLAVDHWPDAVQTYRCNFSGHSVVDASIESLTSKQLCALVGETPDWVVGGPPCQGFSTVGKRLRDDPRNALVREFARVVEVLRPGGFLIENVIGLRDMQFVDAVSDMFGALGYSVTSMVLRAADYGVPQLRHRIFFVGDRTGRSFDPPLPTHKVAKHVSVWDAIGDLPPLVPGAKAEAYARKPFTNYQRAMRNGCLVLQGHAASNHPAHLVEAISHIPDGGNRRSIPTHLQPASGYHNSYSRLNSRLPAVAVTQNMGKPSATRCIHPFQHRGLTAREGARLQGFPDTFAFLSGATSQRLQVANAVSPILAKAIGQALQDEVRWLSAAE